MQLPPEAREAMNMYYRLTMMAWQELYNAAIKGSVTVTSQELEYIALFSIESQKTYDNADDLINELLNVYPWIFINIVRP